MSFIWPVFAGAIRGESGFVDGVGLDARFNDPRDFCHDLDGTLYVADHGNQAIRAVDIATATVTTVLDSSDFGVWLPGAICWGPVAGLVYIAAHLEDSLTNDEVKVFSYDPSTTAFVEIAHSTTYANIGTAHQIQEVTPGQLYEPGVFFSTFGSGTAAGIFETDPAGPPGTEPWKHLDHSSFDGHTGFVILPDIFDIQFTYDYLSNPLTPPDGHYTGRVFHVDFFDASVGTLVESWLYPITDGVLSAPGGQKDGYMAWYIDGQASPNGGDGSHTRLKRSESSPSTGIVTANLNVEYGPDPERLRFWCAVLEANTDYGSSDIFDFPFTRYGLSTEGTNSSVQCALDIGDGLYVLSGADTDGYGNSIRYYSTGGGSSHTWVNPNKRKKGLVAR